MKKYFQRFLDNSHTFHITTNRSCLQYRDIRGPPFNLQRGGCNFCRGQFFYFNRLSGTLKILKIIICLYRPIEQFLKEILYFKQLESVRNYLFQKYSSSSPPPPWRLNGGPLSHMNLTSSSLDTGPEKYTVNIFV